MADWYTNKFFIFGITIIGIILVEFFRFGTKKDSVEFDFREYTEVYYSIIMSALVLLITNYPYEIKAIVESSDAMAIQRLIEYMLCIIVLLIAMIIISVIVRRLGWDKENKPRPLIGLIIPNVIGLILLYWAVVLIGG